MDLVHEASALVDRLAQVDTVAISLALTFHIARRAARARAWQKIVLAAYPHARLPYGTALGVCLAALGIGTLSPIRGGEAARVLLVKSRIRNASYATLTATLVAESIVDAVIAACFCLAALIAGVAPGVAALSVVALGREQLASIVRQARLGVAVIRDGKRFVADVISWIGVSWALRLISLYWFLEAFAIDASIELVLIIVSIQCLSTLVPLTWAGAGAQHGLLIVALAGATGSAGAIAFALGTQAATLLCNVVVGGAAIALLVRGSWREWLGSRQLAFFRWTPRWRALSRKGQQANPGVIGAPFEFDTDLLPAEYENVINDIPESDQMGKVGRSASRWAH